MNTGIPEMTLDIAERKSKTESGRLPGVQLLGALFSEVQHFLCLRLLGGTLPIVHYNQSSIYLLVLG